MNFLWAAIGTTILVVSAGAYAGSRRTPSAGLCQPYDGVVFINGAYQVQTDRDWISLICPIVNDTAVPTGSVNGITVHGWSAGLNGIQAAACVTYAGGGGGDCGGVSATQGPGVGISINQLSMWTSHPDDYAYVRVFLTAGSNVWGITYTTP